jgi:histidyl-tRNA synthetase
VSVLRKKGVFAENDVMGRSLKAQMKYADKIGAKYSVVIGDDEIANGKASLKNMQSGETVTVELNESISDFLK